MSSTPEDWHMPFADSLSDAVRWYASLPPTRVAADFRADGLVPLQSLFNVFRQRGENDEVRAYADLVERAVARRHQLLSQSGPVPAVAWPTPGGRVLATWLGVSMGEEVAAELTSGFFDESDAPPAGLWLGLVVCGRATEPGVVMPVLLSWIPEAELGPIEFAVDAGAPECLAWIPEPEKLFGPAEEARRVACACQGLE